MVCYGMVTYCIEGHGVLNVVLYGIWASIKLWFVYFLRPLWNKSISNFILQALFAVARQPWQGWYIAMTLCGIMYDTRAQKGQRMNLYKMSTGRRGPPYH